MLISFKDRIQFPFIVAQLKEQRFQFSQWIIFQSSIVSPRNWILSGVEITWCIMPDFGPYRSLDRHIGMLLWCIGKQPPLAEADMCLVPTKLVGSYRQGINTAFCMLLYGFISTLSFVLKRSNDRKASLLIVFVWEWQPWLRFAQGGLYVTCLLKERYGSGLLSNTLCVLVHAKSERRQFSLNRSFCAGCTSKKRKFSISSTGWNVVMSRKGTRVSIAVWHPTLREGVFFPIIPGISCAELERLYHRMNRSDVSSRIRTWSRRSLDLGKEFQQAF